MRFKYLRAAFDETVGMPVPMSWMILAFTAMGSYLDWGIGLIGIGMLALYLFVLVNSTRYTRLVDARQVRASQLAALDKMRVQLCQLSVADAGRYREVVSRCERIVAQQQESAVVDDLKLQAIALSRLACVYLQLLVAKSTLENIASKEDAAAISRNIADMNSRLGLSMSAELTRSLQGQLQILRQRQQARGEVTERIAYLGSELERIEQQVELLREQAVAMATPHIVAERIDEVTSTLTDANEWMKQNRELLDEVDDMLSQPPPVLQMLQQK